MPAHRPWAPSWAVGHQPRPALGEPVCVLAKWDPAFPPDLQLLCRVHAGAEGQAMASGRGVPGYRWPGDLSWVPLFAGTVLTCGKAPDLRHPGCPWPGTHGGDEAVVVVLLLIQDPVLDEDRDGPQHEGREQVHVDEVAGAMQLPAQRGRGLEAGDLQHSSDALGAAMGPCPDHLALLLSRMQAPITQLITPLCRSGRHKRGK